MTMPTTPVKPAIAPRLPTGRRSRADGERSRKRILEAAAQLATIEGLDRLSIGELAAQIGMSKSGLYAHFGSKEELQLATIDAAEAIFDEVVVAPMRDAEPGIPAVLVLADSFLDHLRRRVFPGGCFFACASAELQARPGPVKDRIAEFDQRWKARFVEQFRIAQAAGDLPAGEDLDQLWFEIDAYLLYGHAAFAFRNDPAVLDRASDAVRRRLGVRRR
jgi:AcrR family transcriptional regulator